MRLETLPTVIHPAERMSRLPTPGVSARGTVSQAVIAVAIDHQRAANMVPRSVASPAVHHLLQAQRTPQTTRRS
jgi:hypothetical protein